MLQKEKSSLIMAGNSTNDMKCGNYVMFGDW